MTFGAGAPFRAAWDSLLADHHHRTWNLVETWNHPRESRRDMEIHLESISFWNVTVEPGRELMRLSTKPEPSLFGNGQGASGRRTRDVILVLRPRVCVR
jgi:hypothetical protein